jgi:DNA uptake protein ComE-like DNA-binding protein
MKASSALPVFILLLAGCYDANNTRSLQQHTANATAAAKRSAGAIARGVVEGLTRKGPTDINKASEKDLAQLPSVTPAQAKAIIAGRPYDNTFQLVKRGILTRAQYEKIRTQIGVN